MPVRLGYALLGADGSCPYGECVRNPRVGDGRDQPRAHVPAGMGLGWKGTKTVILYRHTDGVLTVFMHF